MGMPGRCVTGQGIVFKLKTGTSDMNTARPVWRYAIIAYGPRDSSLDHTLQEHTDLKEYKRTIDVLAQALEIMSASR
jgi:acetylornithine deacetylase/succinyl-diaminopimelate desuccinylase-like protein